MMAPSKPSCARSLLLESDMEDIFANLPGSAAFKHLDQSIDEEEHVDGNVLTDQDEALLKNVYVKGLSQEEPCAQLMTRKV